jgi:hypothetical protein
MSIESKRIKDKKLQPEDCCDVKFSGRKLHTYERNLSSSPAASGITAKTGIYFGHIYTYTKLHGVIFHKQQTTTSNDCIFHTAEDGIAQSLWSLGGWMMQETPRK